MITIGIDPIVFLNVRWYGIFIALAIVVLILYTARQIRKGNAKITYDTIFSAAIVGIPSGFIVSRLLHVIDQWDFYRNDPGQIFGGGGLTIYGAILGGALGIWVYSKFSKQQFGYLADVVVLGLPLAHAVGRIGCTINGCCYGTESSLPWSFVYTHPDSFAPLGIATHPTVVYEMVFLLIAFGVVMKLRGHLKPDGSLFVAYLALYSLWRLGIDFLRSGTPFIFGLHQAQIVAIIVLAVTVSWLGYRARWVKTEKPTATEPPAQLNP